MTVPLSAFLPFVLASGVLAVWRPTLAILLPLTFHAGYRLRSAITLGEFVLPTTLLEALLLLALLTSALRFRGEILRALGVLPRSGRLLAACFLAAATISAFVAPQPRTGAGNWKAFVMEPALYALALLPLLRTDTGRRQTTVALLLGGALSALGSLSFGARTADFGRLVGLYDVPNSLALVLAPLAAFAGVLSVTADDASLRRRAKLSLAVQLPTILLTQSLAGLGAFAGGLLLVGGTRAFSRKLVSLLLIFVLGGLALQGASGKLALLDDPASPLTARLQIWTVAAALIEDHPLLGTGLGTFEPAYQQKIRELIASGDWRPASGRRPLEWVVRDPHNLVLSFWLHTGLLGLLAMAVLLAGVLRRALRAEAPFSRAAAAALLSFLLFGLVDVSYLKNDLALLWWVFLAAGVVEIGGRRSGVRGES